MTEPDEVTWPEGWVLLKMDCRGRGYAVHIGLDVYAIYQSAGNEQLWYVVEQEYPREGESRDITGQCTTLAEAVESLRAFLDGDYVASGDEIVVRVGGKVTGSLPIFHNRKGEQYVAVPEGARS